MPRAGRVRGTGKGRVGGWPLSSGVLCGLAFPVEAEEGGIRVPATKAHSNALPNKPILPERWLSPSLPSRSGGLAVHAKELHEESESDE